MSGVTSQVSHIRCQASGVTCCILCVTFPIIIAYTINPEIQLQKCKNPNYRIQKYIFQKCKLQEYKKYQFQIYRNTNYRNTNYRNKEIQITERQKYKLHKYINTNYRNTEIQVTKVQKYNYRITEIQVKLSKSPMIHH